MGCSLAGGQKQAAAALEGTGMPALLCAPGHTPLLPGACVPKDSGAAFSLSSVMLTGSLHMELFVVKREELAPFSESELWTLPRPLRALQPCGRSVLDVVRFVLLYRASGASQCLISHHE